MKASELIHCLKNLKEQWGDLDIYFYNKKSDEKVHSITVDFDSMDNPKKMVLNESIERIKSYKHFN